MINFLQLSQLLFNRPLLASGGTVQEVLAQYYLATEHGPEFVGLGKKVTMETEYNTRVFKGTDGTKMGILPVKGMLVYEETGWETLCGMTAYESLQAKAEKMIFDDKVEHIILEVNSGGGMAYGCFETAQYIKRIASENNVRLTTYVDGAAYSGGYAFASIGDEVIVNPMGKVGSIGVVLPLTNTSEKDKKEGVERIYITAGKSKVPYDKDGKFTKEALSDLEEDIMVTYEMFVDHVADMRGISAEAVKNTEAKTFGTEKALELGLIDSVMTKEQFYQHLGNFNGDTSMSITGKQGGARVESDKQDSPVMVALTEQITNLKGDVAARDEQITNLTTAKAAVDGELVTANARIKELEGELKVAQTAQADAVKTARTAKISAYVAADEVEGHLELVDGFSDEKFDKYVSNLEKQHEKVSKSMEEIGVDHKGADPDVNKDGGAVSVDAGLAAYIRKKNGEGEA